MDVEVRHAPAFAVARLLLRPGEAAAVEAGGMFAVDPQITLRARAEGGVVRSWLRSRLGGESFFMTFYEATSSAGWVDIGALLPGDIAVVDVQPDLAWFVQRGSWLAAAADVAIDTRWGGFRNLFGSEGSFLLRATGDGLMVLSAYGALDTWDLQPDQTVRVDTDHLVAYDERVQMRLRTVAGSIAQSMKSGERLVYEFSGPGQVMIQSRNPTEFINYVGAVGSAKGRRRRASSVRTGSGGRS